MKILITFLLTLTLTAQAANILSLPDIPQNLFDKPSLVSQIVSKIQTCTWHLTCYFKPKLGVTITTINVTDLISASRATINTNFDNLNTGKIEVGTTSVASITTLGGLTTAGSLATVGTITSGTWTGSVIDVARQGTGTTSPSLYQVLLGNGSNGITVASSTGTSGQFLTSNGGGAYPTWQTSSVNQTTDYTWTGNHQFGKASTTVFSASSTPTNPINLNGVNLSTPSSQGASSTVLQNNGSGVLSWLGTGSNGSTTVYATAGTYTWIRPAGVTKVKVTLVGGGGGSGGCGGSCTGSSGGGGASGVAMAYVGVSGNVTVVVGAGGTAGSSAGGNGGNGADTTFAGDKTITATGGLLSTGSNSSANTAGGAGSGCTNADFCFTGQTGVTGADANYNSTPGQGGSTGLGFGIGGRVGMSGGSASATGFGYGAGAGGEATQGAGGDAGQAGLAIIEWF